MAPHHAPCWCDLRSRCGADGEPKQPHGSKQDRENGTSSALASPPKPSGMPAGKEQENIGPQSTPAAIISHPDKSRIQQPGAGADSVSQPGVADGQKAHKAMPPGSASLGPAAGSREPRPRSSSLGFWLQRGLAAKPEITQGGKQALPPPPSRMSLASPLDFDEGSGAKPLAQPDVSSMKAAASGSEEPAASSSEAEASEGDDQLDLGIDAQPVADQAGLSTKEPQPGQTQTAAVVAPSRGSALGPPTNRAGCKVDKESFQQRAVRLRELRLAMAQRG